MSSALWIASGLDLALGDPPFAGHPVRLMGRQIEALESWMNTGGARRRFWAGLSLALLLPVAWFAAAFLTLTLLERASPWLAFAASTLLIYFCLGGRDMIAHARAVLAQLEKGSLAGARHAVGLIVGRDTRSLDRAGVSRACVESLAESLGDGWVGPLLFAALGGAPGALAFKAVSTLDSMLGHRNPRYEWFGKASARLDDALNFVPARLSALLIAVCGLPSGRFLQSLRCALADGPLQPSLNAGYPEGAMAGLLGVRLGGPLSYGGRTAAKAFLNGGGKSPGPGQIRPAMACFAVSAFLALLCVEALRALT